MSYKVSVFVSYNIAVIFYPMPTRSASWYVLLTYCHCEVGSNILGQFPCSRILLCRVCSVSMHIHTETLLQSLLLAATLSLRFPGLLFPPLHDDAQDNACILYCESPCVDWAISFPARSLRRFAFLKIRR